MPDYITTVMPETPASRDADNSPNPKLFLKNDLSFSFRKLPIVVKPGRNEPSLVRRLHLVKNYRQLTGSNVIEINTWMLNIFFGIIPRPLVQSIMDKMSYTLIMSNMPGPPSLVLRGGCNLQGAYVFPSHRERTGISITAFTYQNRLYLTLIIDKTLISDQKEAQALMDNIYKYLDLMDTETGRAVREKSSVS